LRRVFLFVCGPGTSSLNYVNRLSRLTVTMRARIEPSIKPAGEQSGLRNRAWRTMASYVFKVKLLQTSVLTNLNSLWTKFKPLYFKTLRRTLVTVGEDTCSHQIGLNGIGQQSLPCDDRSTTVHTVMEQTNRRVTWCMPGGRMRS